MGRVKKERKEVEPVTRDYTVNLHKRMQGVPFKKRAPRAIRELVIFAQKEMYTKDVRIEQGLNRAIWANGIRNLDRKIRIRVSRQRNEDEDAKEKFFSLIQHVAVEDFKGLQTERTKN